MHSAARGDRTGRVAVTQAQADACCALSDASPTTQSSASRSITSTLTPVSVPIGVALIETTHVDIISQSAIPISRSPVPRHLLFSVFLV
jgi:hypothetical protein